MDKLEKLKCQLIEAFASIVRRAQRGGNFTGYCVIREAMLAITFIENFDLPEWQVITTIDKYARAITLI